MGKRLRILIIFFAICLYAFPSLAEEGTKPDIEQIYIELPEITVYGHDFTFQQADEQESYLGGNKISLTEKLKFSESGEGVYYYLLLDVSNSMPDAYFKQIKDSIIKFESTLGPNEHLVLYTFGNEVKVVLDENHDKTETASILSGIRNVDNKTLLFEAISRAADDSQQAVDASIKRKIIMVISDGEDFATGKTMSEEALENLKVKGIPAYAFGIEATARENLNSFGEFSRRSGGALTIFHEKEATQSLLDFHEKVLNSDELRFTTATNLVSNKIEMFSINIIPKSQRVSKEVMVSKWMKDTQPPQITRIVQVSDRQIEMEFSEAVKGIEVASNYTIRKGEANIPVSGINVGVTDDSGKLRENVVILTTGEKLQSGDYEVFCSGIKDISMEENSVSNSGVFTVKAPSFWIRILQIFKNWIWLPIIVIMTVLITLIVFVYLKIKKSKGILYMEQGMVMASDTEVHKHVSVLEKDGKEFQFIISIHGKYPETLSLSLVGSFIVGRSKMSNLYLDDSRMSKQHFAIEWDGENMFITDLNTTNGTMVNGITIKNRRKLEQEDVISAGSTEFKIKW